MDLIINVWKEHLSPLLNPLWESLILWRTLSLILITVFAVFIFYRNKLITFLFNSRSQEHDKNIFSASNAILSERDLIDFLDELQTDDSYWSSQFRQINRFREFFRESGNQYSINKIRKITKELLFSINQLATFVARHFFVYPTGQEGPDLRLCMHPQLNVDRDGEGAPDGMAKYGKLQGELDEKCEDVRNKYQLYRETIKSRLYI